MVDFVKLAATAKRLVEAAGRSVTLRKRDRTADNPAQPWRGPDAEPTPPDGDVETVTMAFVPPRGSQLGRDMGVSESLMASFDQVGLLAHDSLSAGVDIEDFDTVQDGSRAWRIERVESLKPGGTALLYALGLKG